MKKRTCDILIENASCLLPSMEVEEELSIATRAGSWISFHIKKGRRPTRGKRRSPEGESYGCRD